MDRRSFIARLTGAFGTIAVGLSSIPFVRSLLPSARALAQGGPVTIDLSGFRIGPHLHFAVLRNRGMDVESLPVVFEGASGIEVTPETGVELVAYQAPRSRNRPEMR